MFKQNCTFHKKYENTSLRVFYGGSLRTRGSNSCSRWYFTFNGEECKKPATIEGIIYGTWKQTPRPSHIEGYCNQFRKGQIRVEFKIGRCTSNRLGDATTGYLSQSRIVIEEIPPSQA